MRILLAGTHTIAVLKAVKMGDAVRAVNERTAHVTIFQ
jgi:hypothetical protein